MADDTPIDTQEISLEFARLPKAFDGFRIALLTDLHYGRYVRKGFVRRLLATVERLRPDMLLMCGDLVERPRHFARELAEILREICGRLPTYAVPGNHDYYSGFGGFRRIMRAAGVDLLVNENRLIRRGEGDEEAMIALVGLDDDEWGQTDAAAATTGTPDGVFTIVATHDPIAVELIGSDCRPDVMLAGHTHGGQVRIFGKALGCDSNYRYQLFGLSHEPGFPIYISRGLGMTGIPIRYDSMPELPMITLRTEVET